MLIGNGTWVLVADGSKFLLFRNQGNSTAPVLVTVAHEEMANPATSEYGSDRPGRSFFSGGAGNDFGRGQRRSSYGNTDWHRQAKEHFAVHVSDILHRATEHDKGMIVAIASAQTLGNLRKHYARGVAHRLQMEITKDLVGHTTDEIVDVILTHTP